MKLRRIVGILSYLSLATVSQAGSDAPSNPSGVVSKWTRFEHAFESSVIYSNAVQDVSLKVRFTSPLGETTEVQGFWDSGKTWRVRFAPDQPGSWTYETQCSDPANTGLTERGTLVCTAATGQNRFNQHGPIILARDRRHFQHADGTAFFWLADVTWDGPRSVETNDWYTYAGSRAAQKFSAVQWSVTPGVDLERRPAFVGTDRISLNPDYFQRLDQRLETLNRAGLLGVITPFWNIEGEPETELPEDQAILLLRYMVARWGANDVAWLIALPQESASEIVRWKNIGRAVFDGQPHAPVILFVPGTNANWQEFQDEKWADAFGYGVGPDMPEDAFQRLALGAISGSGSSGPDRPVLNVLPPYEHPGHPPSGRAGADDVRRVAWWSLLGVSPAGVTYAAAGIADWNSAGREPAAPSPRGNAPIWQRSLLLPGAAYMTQIAACFNSIEFWRLNVHRNPVPASTGRDAVRSRLVAAFSPTHDLGIIYNADGHSVDVQRDAMPSQPLVTWINPRTGQKSPAFGAVTGERCRFAAPGSGDSVLLLRSGKWADPFRDMSK